MRRGECEQKVVFFLFLGPGRMERDYGHRNMGRGATIGTHRSAGR